MEDAAIIIGVVVLIFIIWIFTSVIRIVPAVRAYGRPGLR